MTLEYAEYVIRYYSRSMTLHEVKALKHHYSTLNLEGTEYEEHLTDVYSKFGWLPNDPLISSYLNDGYEEFSLKRAARILNDDPDKVFFNLCPACEKLARTPYAKQCRHCGHDGL